MVNAFLCATASAESHHRSRADSCSNFFWFWMIQVIQCSGFYTPYELTHFVQTSKTSRHFVLKTQYKQFLKPSIKKHKSILQGLHATTVRVMLTVECFQDVWELCSTAVITVTLLLGGDSNKEWHHSSCTALLIGQALIQIKCNFVKTYYVFTKFTLHFLH